MNSVTVPVYHHALLKSHLAGQNAPPEVLAAVEALHMAAVQGPLRPDALDAIQAVREAAEKLAGVAMASPKTEVPSAKPEVAGAIFEAAEIDLPPLTKRALEKASERITPPEPPSEPQADESKIADFLAEGTAEQCPAAHAGGDDHEVVVDPAEPKKSSGWTPERRAAQAERAKAQRKRPFDVDFNAVKADFDAGLSMDAIGKKWNCSGGHIRNFLAKHGVDPRRAPARIKLHSHE